jgi:hypothetical protein
MELYILDGHFSWFIAGSLYWFSFYSIACLVTRVLARDKLKQEAVNIQTATNMVIAIIAIVDMILWGILLYEVRYSATQYEWYAFKEYQASATIFITGIILFWLTSLLFLVRKFRQSWVLSVLVLVFINVDFLFSLWVKLWRDYLPSEWQTEDESWLISVMRFLMFTGLVFISYFLLHRRKKLPYPSSWLR